MSVCLSVQTITFELLHIETSFFVCRYIFTILRSSLSIKVIGSRSRSCEKIVNFTCFKMLIFCMWLQVINKVKFIHQGEGHIRVKAKISTSIQSLCSPYSPEAGGMHSTEMHSCFQYKSINSLREIKSEKSKTSITSFFSQPLNTCHIQTFQSLSNRVL